MLYFAYGSNMSQKRLGARVPSAGFLSVATLPMHELRFHKVSHVDGSAKCDAFETGNVADRIIGVVFEIAVAEEKRTLDRIEGLGAGYDEKVVTVLSPTGESLEATLYYATETDPAMKPFHWYKEHVLRGAAENGLPGDYIRSFIDVESIADHDTERHEKEMAIHR